MPSPYAGVDFSNLLPSLGNAMLGAGQTMLSAPRQAAWNIGPFLVGRPGQGPQSGAEALQRLGMDYGSPAQRAIGHGAGAGLDFMADPLMLSGLGATRTAAPAAEAGGALTRRLERMVAPVAESNARGRQVTQARIENWMQGVGHPRIEFAPGAGGPDAWFGVRARSPAALPATVPGGAPTPTVPQNRTNRPGSGRPGSVQEFALDPEAGRTAQLNSPNFNPAEPVFGLGTSQFTQDPWLAARMGAQGAPNPLTTARFMPGAEAASTPSLVQHLESMSTMPSSTNQWRRALRDPAPNNMPMSGPELGPLSGSSLPNLASRPLTIPINPRGGTLGPRSPTLPNGPIDY